MEKRCPKCGETKPLDEFYPVKTRDDGRSSYCRPCTKSYVSGRYEKKAPKPRPPEGMKKCSRCKEIKPTTEFHSNVKNAGGLSYYCGPCAVASVTESRQKNPQAHRDGSKRWREANRELNADMHARWTKGVPIGTYARLFEAQGGKCAICGTTSFGAARLTRFHIDHCHDTGVVRGLLCGPCNTGIGQLRHSEEILLKAVAYLQNYPSTKL